MTNANASGNDDEEPAVLEAEVEIPSGYAPGDSFWIEVNGRTVEVTVPEGCAPGSVLTIEVPGVSELHFSESERVGLESSEPSQTLQPAAELVEVNVEVPAQSNIGDTFAIEVHGKLYSVQVPEDSHPGGSFKVAVASDNTGPAKQEPGDVDIIVPDSVKAGDLLHVDLGGRQLQVVVPHHCGPGSLLRLRERPAESRPASSICSSAVSKVEVAIPAGCKPGETFYVNVGGRDVLATVPPDAAAGDMVTLQLPVSSEVQTSPPSSPAEPSADQQRKEAPSSATAPAEPREIEIEIPEDCHAGDTFIVVVEGKELEICVPDGCGPGSLISINIDMDESPAKSAAAEEPSTEEIEIVIPDGLKPGDAFQVEYAGKMIEVDVPKDCGPGSTIAIAMPVTPKESKRQEPAQRAVPAETTPSPGAAEPVPATSEAKPAEVQAETTTPAADKPAAATTPQETQAPAELSPPVQQAQREPDTVEIEVVIPDGLRPGDAFEVEYAGKMLEVTVPPDCGPGSAITLSIPVTPTGSKGQEEPAAVPAAAGAEKAASPPAAKPEAAAASATTPLQELSREPVLGQERPAAAAEDNQPAYQEAAPEPAAATAQKELAAEPNTVEIEIVIPDGLKPGDAFEVEYEGKTLEVEVPEGCGPGSSITIGIPVTPKGSKSEETPQPAATAAPAATTQEAPPPTATTAAPVAAAEEAPPTATVAEPAATTQEALAPLEPSNEAEAQPEVVAVAEADVVATQVGEPAPEVAAPIVDAPAAGHGTEEPKSNAEPPAAEVPEEVAPYVEPAPAEAPKEEPSTVAAAPAAAVETSALSAGEAALAESAAAEPPAAAQVPVEAEEPAPIDLSDPLAEVVAAAVADVVHEQVSEPMPELLTNSMAGSPTATFYKEEASPVQVESTPIHEEPSDVAVPSLPQAKSTSVASGDIEVVIPDAVVPGDTFLVVLEDGRELEVAVPEGCCPGSVILINPTAAEEEQAAHGEIPKEEPPIATFGEAPPTSTQPPTPAEPASHETRQATDVETIAIGVTVPVGSQAGDVFMSEWNGRPFEVKVPLGSGAGSLITVQVPLEPDVEDFVVTASTSSLGRDEVPESPKATKPCVETITEQPEEPISQPLVPEPAAAAAPEQATAPEPRLPEPASVKQLQLPVEAAEEELSPATPLKRPATGRSATSNRSLAGPPTETAPSNTVKRRDWADEEMAAAKWLLEAQAVLICCGSGSEAAPFYQGGQVYSNEEDFSAHYPGMQQYGFRTAADCVNLVDSRLSSPEKWAFWAEHMQKTRKLPLDEGTVERLGVAVGEKDYFVYSCNADCYFERAGFDKRRIYTPAGSWRYYQCAKPCCDSAVFEATESWLAENGNGTSAPSCPLCGAECIPNVRISEVFCHGRYSRALDDLIKWIQRCAESQLKLVVLELDSSFKTSRLASFPMESIAADIPGSSLIRFSPEKYPFVPAVLQRAVGLPTDTFTELPELLEKMLSADGRQRAAAAEKRLAQDTATRRTQRQEKSKSVEPIHWRRILEHLGEGLFNCAYERSM